MSVTQEGGGRLNTFAKEPQIEVIKEKPSGSLRSRLITIFGIVLLGGCITIAFGIS